ncbi:hypothetical protein AN219_22375 [Streptomyces nanshensis]|nr:hypothetical protein AN219_22375 [Streptomyces nanshensis]
MSVATAAGPGTTAAASQTSAAAASCGVTWGSLPKTGTGTGDRSLTDVRTGRHDCYDRMVLDIRPGMPANPASYQVRYVDKFYQDGSGNHIKINGGAILEIVASAPSYDPETYEATYPGRGGKPLPGVNLKGYKTFRDARFGASYEGTTQLGLGVRARLPFRVLELSDRIVIDVAHTWAAPR